MGFSFINNLDKEKDKKKFQKFEVTSGFEKISVVIPFEESSLFEAEMLELKPTKHIDISEMVSKFKGHIE